MKKNSIFVIFFDLFAIYMKIGNKRISISFIEIAGSVIAIIGIVLFFVLEEPLISILSLCVSAICMLGLFIKLNTKINAIVTNQFATTQHKRTNIHAESQTVAPIDGADKYEEIQINNRGFVIVNRSEKSNATSQATQMHAYNVDEQSDYNMSARAYTILPVEDSKQENEAKTIQETNDNTVTENNELPTITQVDSPSQISDINDNDFSTTHIKLTENTTLCEETVLPASINDTPREQISLADAVQKEETVTPISSDDTHDKELEGHIKGVIEQAFDDTQYNVELHISDMLDATQCANPSLIDLNRIIVQMLVLIAQNIRYTTAGLVWVNYEKQQLILDNYVCDSDIKDFMIDRFDIADNIFTDIINTARPLFLVEKHQADVEQQYFQYHSQPIGIKSFIGIPIIHNKTVTAILFVDTNRYKYSENNEYSIIKSLDKIFSHLISLYENNINNENATKLLEVIYDFSAIVSKRGSNFKDICLAITDFVQRYYTCTNVGVVTYNTNDENWTVSTYLSNSNEPVQKQFLYEPVDIQKSLIGASIIKFQQVLLSTVPSGFIRVNEYEPGLSHGSFISIPIKSTTVCYGALFIESHENLVKSVHVKALETVCNQAGEMFERLKLVQLFDDYVSVEIGTGILTPNAFQRSMNAEIARVVDSANPLILILVALDKYSYFDDAYKKSQIFQYVIELLKAQLKPFEIIGRVREDIVGMLLFNRDIHHVQLMMEAINKKLATQYIEIQKEKFIATISVGINEFTSKDDWTSFTTNATAVLNLAQKERNTVKIFQ